MGNSENEELFPIQDVPEALTGLNSFGCTKAVTLASARFCGSYLHRAKRRH